MYAGEIAALMATGCWMISALSFEASGKRIGSLPVNIIRLVLGICFMELFLIFTRAVWIPVIPEDGSFWLMYASGFVGFFIGDMMLFRSYVEIGSRVALLILSFVPPITAFMEWIILGQLLSLQGWISMAVTLTGVLLVLLKSEDKKFKLKHPIKGILLAVGGTLGQSTGMILSRSGIGSADPVQATLIRALAALTGFIPFFFILGIWPKVFKGMRNKQAMAQLSLGSLFGPFIGVTLMLYAMQHTTAARVSIITALIPVVVIPPSIILFKDKIGMRELIGACIAVFGVIILFI
ncbi:DMT family transporter [Oceanispirochaeta crateris]|uniref:DMT family transporter n=1 Tax=Oceanispirochaeta crateris TaxID=2518645 RepID=A0A5C1QI55_9SPIO|nr:DMT family transporter [Oceanispirochaeta crateris]QEN07251.1 DMT family transporter [Oceanispirochaeta crateris]